MGKNTSHNNGTNGANNTNGATSEDQKVNNDFQNKRHD